MSLNNVFNNHRLLLLYKGDISALTLFAQHSNGSICFPEPLPLLSSALEPEEFEESKVSVHPSMLVNAMNQLLQLDNDLLHAEPGFYEQIDTPGGVITVYMARFKLLDPPHKLMQSRDCKLRTLPELRGRPPAEMELLRRAYVKMMEG
ncbi:MAG: hypothetical protein Q8N35_16515 [Methylococcaceae bacterium]|nr:hypothetical protein [Methylococcaceae bacterium]MDZ4157396.1 hypothetical protein [Methylococcales bacterium]MDP2392685.1 hypothetical protein [Methylococcaceae bacterium]MDP3021186.1 hypothetical protein [Methylococcaceae bacterium]MDP3390129.1 hypothetical protein [Methylococcaceae bacterium]